MQQRNVLDDFGGRSVSLASHIPALPAALSALSSGPIAFASCLLRVKGGESELLEAAESDRERDGEADSAPEGVAAADPVHVAHKVHPQRPLAGVLQRLAQESADAPTLSQRMGKGERGGGGH